MIAGGTMFPHRPLQEQVSGPAPNRAAPPEKEALNPPRGMFSGFRRLLVHAGDAHTASRVWKVCPSRASPELSRKSDLTANHSKKQPATAD